MRTDQSCLCHLYVKKLALTCSSPCSRCAKNCTRKKKKKRAEFLLRPPCALLSTRSRVWQLHVDILPAAYSELQQGWGRKKVKSDRVAVAERCKSAHGPPSSVEKLASAGTESCNKNALSAFFDHQDYFVLPRVGSQLVPVGRLPTIGTV